MAMNKKEQAEMENIRNEMRKARALRFTDKVYQDVLPPSHNEGYGKLNTGFVFNSHNCSIDIACSSSFSHGKGQANKTTSQQAISMFSSRLLALKAMRNEIEQECAKKLAKIDGYIEKEICQQQPTKGTEPK